MESFTKDLQGILNELNEADQQANEIISGFNERFDRLVSKFIETKTPLKPTKKRPKGRLDKLDSLDDSFSSTNSSRTVTTTSIDINDENDESQLLRPVRTGRAKQPTSYKEPKLNTKLRRDEALATKIKTERISTDSMVNESKVVEVNESKVEPVRNVRVKKEKDDNQRVSKLTVAQSKAANETNKKLSKDSVNDSLEIVTMETNAPIELSDEENGDDGNKMPPPAFVPPPVKPVKEKKAPVERVTRTTRSKQTKRTKIKQEPVSESEDEALATTGTLSTKTNEAVSTEPPVVKTTKKPASDKAKPAKTINTTAESLYEDAVSEPITNNRDTLDNKTPLSQQCDATFVTTTDEQVEQLSPRGTYIIPGSAAGTSGVDATFMVPSAVNNQTVVVEANGKGINRPKKAANSLLTDDESDTESISNSQNTKKKDPKELFNPCVSKPIKQRVEAFEKLQTPQKETRTKARVGNTETDRYARAQANGAKLVASSSSDSTGRHLRTNSATRQNTTKPILAKAMSVEEIRKKNQAVVDEKKKKQDEKLRKAQLLRETQEKEKSEKQRKMLLEKEQRAKEKLLLKQQEEMLKMQEQKRKEAEREQKRKDALAKKAAADRREQEHYMKVLAEKKAMQEQLKLNKLKAEDQRRKNAYNFDMLESGDSTDEECKQSSKRPPPPSWSTAQNRHAYVLAQTRVNLKVIDKFFSVAPHDVDLREIFPTIDERYLRRNSSAVWNSPPRYSQLPKY